MQMLFSSPDLHDAALFLNRMVLGVFFLLARYRWVYDQSHPEAPWFNDTRHESLRHKLAYCGLKNPKLFAPVVAYIEIFAALGVIVGLMTPLAALGLLVILLRATQCTGKEKTLKQNPIDRVDTVSCYLWCPEPVYIVLAVTAMFMGAGAWSLDAVVLGWVK